jgi:uncharacterized protein YlxP (DUF503 family)
MKLSIVMVSGKRIELEKKKSFSADKWLKNSKTFIDANPSMMALEDENGNVIYQKGEN